MAWVALAICAGGSDTGVQPGAQQLRGSTAALLATVVLAPMGAAALGSRRVRAVLGTAPGRASLGGAALLAVWGGLSLTWAAGPALAWIEVNRLVMYALALITMVAAARPGAGRLRGPASATVWASLVVVPVVAWALLGKVVPQLAGDFAAARLQGPLPSFNAMALLAAMAVPGALFVAARAGRHGLPTWAAPLAAAWTAVLLVTVVLTYSRSGLLAVVAAIAVTVAIGPGRDRMLAAVGAALLGAIPAAAYGLRADALATDGLSASQRMPEGPILGAALLVGGLIAAGLCVGVERLLRRTDLAGRRRFTQVVGGALGAGVVAVGALAVSRAGSDEGVGNDASRLVSGSFNNRLDWWGEALRGFADRPLLGHGAGSFPLVHVAERDNAIVVQQPHQAVLQQLAELGAVGAAAWLALMAGLIWAGVRVARRHGRGAAGPALGVLTAFLVNAQLDWAWSIPATVLLPLAVGGVLLGSSVVPAVAGRAAPPAIGIAVAAIVVVSAALPWASGVIADRAWARVASDPSAAREGAQLAADLNPLDSRPLRVLAVAAKRDADRAGQLRAAAEGARREPLNAYALTCQLTALGTGAPGVFPVQRELDALVNGSDATALSGVAGCG